MFHKKKNNKVVKYASTTYLNRFHFGVLRQFREPHRLVPSCVQGLIYILPKRESLQVYGYCIRQYKNETLFIVNRLINDNTLAYSRIIGSIQAWKGLDSFHHFLFTMPRLKKSPLLFQRVTLHFNQCLIPFQSCPSNPFRYNFNNFK